MGGDHAVLFKAFFPDDAHGLSFQLRGGGIGLDLDVQLDFPLAQVQHLFQCGDLRTGVPGTEPPPGIQLPHLCKGQVVNIGVAAGAAAQAGVVGHHDHTILCHLHIQLGPVAVVVDGQLKGGQGVLRCSRRIAAVCRDDGSRAAQHGAQLIIRRQGNINKGKADCDQRDADHRSGQQATALRTDGLPILGILRHGITLPQTAVQQKQDAALRNGDGAVEQELEERHLDQQAGAGQRHHGSGVLEPDAQNDRVQRCQYAQGQAARTEDCREIPAQQKQRCAENSLPHEPDALPDGLPQAAALQDKQGQHQRTGEKQ